MRLLFAKAPLEIRRGFVLSGSPQGHANKYLRYIADPALVGFITFTSCPSVKTKAQPGIFFCTFTCFKWLPLIDKVSMYGWVHDWFRRLHADGNKLVAYVIMPNHLHVLLHVPKDASINDLLAQGKRFMAYEIRKRLQEARHTNLLTIMADGVRTGDADRGQQYRVFEPSSDVKDCWSEKFLRQKLDYIHNNPVSGKWSLVDDPAIYPYSSAGYYMLGSEPVVPLLHLGELL